MYQNRLLDRVKLGLVSIYPNRLFDRFFKLEIAIMYQNRLFDCFRTVAMNPKKHSDNRQRSVSISK